MHRRQFLHYTSLTGAGFAFAACGQGNNLTNGENFIQKKLKLC
jgi:hypothetical protein